VEHATRLGWRWSNKNTHAFTHDSIGRGNETRRRTETIRRAPKNGVDEENSYPKKCMFWYGSTAAK